MLNFFTAISFDEARMKIMHKFKTTVILSWPRIGSLLVSKYLILIVSYFLLLLRTGIRIIVKCHKYCSIRTVFS